MDTVLFIPDTPIPIADTSPPPTSAAIECQLERAADVFLFFGAIAVIVAGGAAFLFIGSATYVGQRISGTGTWFAIGLTAAAEGFLARVLFRAAAEVIRLLKKSNGMPFDGEISR